MEYKQLRNRCLCFSFRFLKKQSVFKEKNKKQMDCALKTKPVFLNPG